MTLTLGQVCLRNGTCRRIPFNLTNSRMHWSVRSRWNHAWEDAVQVAIWELGRKKPKFPLVKPTVTITFAHIREFDDDGKHSAVKPLLDALVRLGVIEDDSPKHITLQVKQTKVAHREDEHVELTIN